jgi:hypothetical protein
MTMDKASFRSRFLTPVGAVLVTTLSIFGALGQAGLRELICRWRSGKRSAESVKIFSPAPVLMVLGGLAATYFFLLWGLGVHFFYIYVQGYRALFS